MANTATYSLTYLEQIGLKYNSAYLDLYVPIVGPVISELFSGLLVPSYCSPP